MRGRIGAELIDQSGHVSADGVQHLDAARPIVGIVDGLGLKARHGGGAVRGRHPEHLEGSESLRHPPPLMRRLAPT
jgi:hypothetical protein